jgi:hypothetical protein
VAAILLVLGSGAASHAAPTPQSPDRPPATAQERGDLRHTIEARYQVLPVSGGVLLTPRQAKAGVRTIELKGSQIAVNGEPVSARILRDWLGADADPVIRLQGLSAADQRQLFGLGADAAAVRPPAAPPEAPAAPEVSTEAPTSDTDVAEETSTEAPETPEAPEPSNGPERRSSGERINVGGSVQIDKDEAADEAVAVGGSVDVAGEVRRDVTAIGGPVRIEGRVGGEVVCVGGSVYLGPHAVVEGDVTSVGGGVHREPGSVLNGSTHEVGMFPFSRHRGFHVGPVWRHWGFWGGVSDLMGSLMGLLFMGMLVCLVLLIARRPLERVDRVLALEPWKAAGVGLAGVVFFLPVAGLVTLLLLFTIVGCALYLLYPFIAIYILLLILLGYTTVVYRVGRLVEGRFSLSLGNPYAAALLGLLMIQGWSVLGHLLDLLPGPFGVLMSLFGVLVVIAALIVGIGAVILSRFGLHPGYWPRRGAPMTQAPPAQAVAPLPLSDLPPNPPAERWEE